MYDDLYTLQLYDLSRAKAIYCERSERLNLKFTQLSKFADARYRARGRARLSGTPCAAVSLGPSVVCVRVVYAMPLRTNMAMPIR